MKEGPRRQRKRIRGIGNLQHQWFRTKKEGIDENKDLLEEEEPNFLVRYD